jgi:hypothetical protein
MRLHPDVRRVALLAALLVPFGAAAGCGPNLRSAYESSYEWERCRSLDDDPNLPNEERLRCWSMWLENDSAGQPPDRIQSARARVAALLGNGPTSQASAGGEAASTSAAAAPVGNAPPPPPPPPPPPAREPAPPPPPPPSAVVGPVPAGGESGGSTAPPGAGCATTCRSNWTTCSGPCGGADAACVARCDDSYRDCMRGCY